MNNLNLAPSKYFLELDLITTKIKGRIRKRTVEEHRPAVMVYDPKTKKYSIKTAEIKGDGEFLKVENHGFIKRHTLYEIRNKRKVESLKQLLKHVIDTQGMARRVKR